MVRVETGGQSCQNLAKREQMQAELVPNVILHLTHILMPKHRDDSLFRFQNIFRTRLVEHFKRRSDS